MARAPTLDDLRRHAVARTLWAPTSLGKCIERLGFVQADPIRAPARAQDLILRHRVASLQAGDLERRYPRLAIEEDCLVNYGFLPRALLALMHPRVAAKRWDRATRRRAADVQSFVRERGEAHPRDVLAEFAAAWGARRVVNAWGGSSGETTHLLDGMHYRGLLRVARREAGTRVYAAADHADVDDSEAARADRAAALLRLVVRLYAPLPASSLVYLARLLNYGAPHLREHIQATLRATRDDILTRPVDGALWSWPRGENPASARHAPVDRVRLLAPFDPVVWDRTRFEALWGWRYRFEAYTPAARRQLGYYALPLLWRDQVIGWANASRGPAGLTVATGYVAGKAPRDAVFRRELDAEIDALRRFVDGESAVAA